MAVLSDISDAPVREQRRNLQRARLVGAQAAHYPCAMQEPPTAAEIARRAGIDLGLLADNLRLSHEQRVLQHQDALNLALELERVGQDLRERSATAAASAR